MVIRIIKLLMSVLTAAPVVGDGVAAALAVAEGAAEGVLAVVDPEALWPLGRLLRSLGNGVMARFCIWIPLLVYTGCDTLKSVICTSRPLFGFLMPLSIRSCPPDGIGGMSKVFLNFELVIRLLWQRGPFKDVAVEVADSSRVTFKELY